MLQSVAFSSPVTGALKPLSGVPLQPAQLPRLLYSWRNYLSCVHFYHQVTPLDALPASHPGRPPRPGRGWLGWLQTGLGELKPALMGALFSVFPIVFGRAGISIVQQAAHLHVVVWFAGSNWLPGLVGPQSDTAAFWYATNNTTSKVPDATTPPVTLPCQLGQLPICPLLPAFYGNRVLLALLLLTLGVVMLTSSLLPLHPPANPVQGRKSGVLTDAIDHPPPTSLLAIAQFHSTLASDLGVAPSLRPLVGSAEAADTYIHTHIRANRPTTNRPSSRFRAAGACEQPSSSRLPLFLHRTQAVCHQLADSEPRRFLRLHAPITPHTHTRSTHNHVLRQPQGDRRWHGAVARH